MQMEKSMINGHRNGELDLNDYLTAITIDSESASSFVSPCKLLRPSSPPPASGVGGGGLSYIEHQVSKFDTLAGVAIKYGVEVADVKKMNGLITDQQMFALKTLHIPLPGRHPPSPILTNGVDDKRPSSSERTPLGRRHSDFFDSFQSLKSSSQCEVSPAMSSSQGYYGLKQPAKEKVFPEGFEMSMYSSKQGSHYLEHGTSTKSGTPSNLPLSLHRKSKSVANGFYSDNGNLGTQEAKDNNWGGAWIEKFVRRRPKSEIDLESGAQDTLLKEENNNAGVFSALASKGLGLRPKSGNRNVSGIDAEGGFLNVFSDPPVADSNGVRKSSSTPSFLESENGTSASSSSSSIWSMSMWNLKPDFQALSTAAITKPIFDGLPLPIPGRKSKTALD
ncbi:hypothetical protein Leryth_002940 [Lithospermum erythrorhizon]|nr:hypothetical protein Leryth_002940 [Lithospermum erythrorhizon]